MAAASGAETVVISANRPCAAASATCGLRHRTRAPAPSGQAATNRAAVRGENSGTRQGVPPDKSATASALSGQAIWSYATIVRQVLPSACKRACKSPRAWAPRRCTNGPGSFWARANRSSTVPCALVAKSPACRALRAVRSPTHSAFWPRMIPPAATKARTPFSEVTRTVSSAQGGVSMGWNTIFRRGAIRGAKPPSSVFAKRSACARGRVNRTGTRCCAAMAPMLPAKGPPYKAHR